MVWYQPTHRSEIARLWQYRHESAWFRDSIRANIEAIRIAQ